MGEGGEGGHKSEVDTNQHGEERHAATRSRRQELRGHEITGTGKHQQLVRLLSADGNGARNLLVTADAEGAHGVPGLAIDRLLAGELLENLRRGGPGFGGSRRVEPSGGRERKLRERRGSCDSASMLEVTGRENIGSKGILRQGAPWQPW